MYTFTTAGGRGNNLLPLAAAMLLLILLLYSAGCVGVKVEKAAGNSSGGGNTTPAAIAIPTTLPIPTPEPTPKPAPFPSILSLGEPYLYGSKAIRTTAVVYRAELTKCYDVQNPEMGSFYTNTTVAKNGMQFLFVFVRMENYGTLPNWLPSAPQFVLWADDVLFENRMATGTAANTTAGGPARPLRVKRFFETGAECALNPVLLPHNGTEICLDEAVRTIVGACSLPPDMTGLWKNATREEAIDLVVANCSLNTGGQYRNLTGEQLIREVTKDSVACLGNVSRFQYLSEGDYFPEPDWDYAIGAGSPFSTHYLYPGESNAVSGYLIFEVPEKFELGHLYLLAQFNSQHQGIWHLVPGTSPAAGTHLLSGDMEGE